MQFVTSRLYARNITRCHKTNFNIQNIAMKRKMKNEGAQAPGNGYFHFNAIIFSFEYSLVLELFRMVQLFEYTQLFESLDLSSSYLSPSRIVQSSTNWRVNNYYHFHRGSAKGQRTSSVVSTINCSVRCRRCIASQLSHSLPATAYAYVTYKRERESGK